MKNKTTEVAKLFHHIKRGFTWKVHDLPYLDFCSTPCFLIF